MKGNGHVVMQGVLSWTQLIEALSLTEFLRLAGDVTLICKTMFLDLAIVKGITRYRQGRKLINSAHLPIGSRHQPVFS